MGRESEREQANGKGKSRDTADRRPEGELREGKEREREERKRD